MKTLKSGHRVRAMTKICRRDGGSVMSIGSTGVITSVWNSENCQIVGVQPDDKSQLPMIDIVCMFDSPPVFEVVK